MSTLETEEIAAVPGIDAPLSVALALNPQQPQARCTSQPKASANMTTSAGSSPLPGAVTGTLIGFRDDERVPLVLFAGQRGSAAVAAASTVDVQGSHIGHRVVLVFEKGDADRPIIIGLLRGQQAWPLAETPGQVQVDADGERLTVSAKEQLVLRCGKASITLTKAGKVLIQGEYVSTSSSGVLRVKGGSVQVN